MNLSGAVLHLVSGPKMFQSPKVFQAFRLPVCVLQNLLRAPASKTVR